MLPVPVYPGSDHDVGPLVARAAKHLDNGGRRVLQVGVDDGDELPGGGTESRLNRSTEAVAPLVGRTVEEPNRQRSIRRLSRHDLRGRIVAVVDEEHLGVDPPQHTAQLGEQERNGSSLITGRDARGCVPARRCPALVPEQAG